MIALLNAIQTKLNATGSLISGFPPPSGSTLTLNYYREKAPEGCPQPYLISNVISSAPSLFYGPGHWDEAKIQFSAIGIGHDTIGNLMETFAGVFDDLLLTVSGASNFNTRRAWGPICGEEPKSPDVSGNIVWRWMIAYNFDVQ